MLSRAVFTLRNGVFGTPHSTGLVFKRACSVTIEIKQKNFDELPDPPAITKDGPERDLVNFPRRKREEYGGKVRLGFLPDDWFQFFYKKTGVTGPYLFGIGFVTTMMSKEFYVIDHEFYNGISMVALCYLLIKYLGPTVSDWANKAIDEEEKLANDTKQGNIDGLAKAIEHEKGQQKYALDQKNLFDAKRENILLQLEAEYRQRAMRVYNAFKRRLDYQIEIQASRKNVEHRHMVNWIINSVIKSITPQQEADALKKCIGDLKVLASASR